MDHFQRIHVSSTTQTVPALPSLYDFFAPGGVLSRSQLPYEFRRGQLEMAQAVERALDENRHLIVEAGTGTGKTLAYLLPALRSGRRVIISTGTKNLQEQLFFKDIPFLESLLGPLRVCYMKGRANYLCRHKLYALRSQPILTGLEEISQYQQIAEWEKTTETGDRVELDDLPETSQLWSKLDARSDACLGQSCPDYDRCFITEMRRRAAESDVIIVNHHLFFADLAVKLQAKAAPDAGILPEAGIVIFDEAHELEDVASSYFGISLSNIRFEELARDLETMLRAKQSLNSSIIGAAQTARERARLFFAALPTPAALRARAMETVAPSDGRMPFLDREDFLEASGDLYLALTDALHRLEARARAPARSRRIRASPQARRRHPRAVASSCSKPTTATPSSGSSAAAAADKALARSPICRPRPSMYPNCSANCSSRISPASCSPRPRSPCREASLTSASAWACAMPASSSCPRTSVTASRRCSICRPTCPTRATAIFRKKPRSRIRRMLDITEGRAFCLFTSYQQMRDLYERLLVEVGYPLLLQGTAPRKALLEEFRETPNAVLFGTSSFWQGVDVQGEALSCVIVDRLPFAVPTDPVVQARMRAIEEGGGNPFFEYQVPSAVITLKQGFGRLIRSLDDRGVLMLLDPRIQRQRYGRIFIESLPPYRITQDITVVEAFFSHS